MKITMKLAVIMAAAVVMVPKLPAAGNQAKEETGDVTITAFVQSSASTESGIWQGWGAKKLYDDLNIKVDFLPTSREVAQKLQQYLAAYDLPDVVGFNQKDQGQRALDAEALLPLDQYEDKLPALFKSGYYNNAIAYSRDTLSLETGHLYLMPFAIGPTGYNSFNWQPLLQWDAWKKAGGVVPKTLEDYLDIVEAMVKVKPVTPHGEKVYGFSLSINWDKYSAAQVSTLSFMYGIDTEYVSYLMESNVLTRKINSILADDSFYHRALRFYFNANQRGLFDPDSMTQTYSNLDAKYSAGRVLFSHFSWMTGSYNASASGYVNNVQAPDGYVPVVADDMKLYIAPNQTIGRAGYYGLSKNLVKEPKKLDAALAFLNWIYTPEVNAYLMNGPEGLIWGKSASGEPEIINVPEKTAIFEKNSEPLMPSEIGGGAFRDGTWAINYTGLQAPVVMPNGFTVGFRYWPSYLFRNQTVLQRDWNNVFGANSLQEYVDAKGLKANSTQAVSMVPPVTGDLEMVVTQIGEVVKKYSWQMVYAASQAQFNSLWNQMKVEAGGLGLDKVVDYYTDGWNKALELVSKYE
jgi:hypothetical protein